VDLHEEGAAEGTAAAEEDGVSGMNAEVAQSALHAVSGSDGDDACLVPRSKLIQCHESLMITILILKSSGVGPPLPTQYPRSPMLENRFQDLFERLHAAYGPQSWWPADDPFEVIVGAVLTQRTTWRNVEHAMRGLRGSGLLSVEALDNAAEERIAEAVRPAGFYNAKARKLKAFSSFLTERYGGRLSVLFSLPTDDLRDELLGVFGIGEETADAILVYAAGKPSFVIDAYARRLLKRLEWIDGSEPYGELRDLFLRALPSDVRRFGEFHALIVRHGKAHCRARPACEGCPIRSICAAGKEIVQ